MRTRYSIILPIAAILSGVVLELNSLNLLGNFLPNEILLKAWPVLLVFVGFDMLFSQRRLIGAIVLFFCAAALLSTQFMDTGTNNQIWTIFKKIWPILLILFGIDCIFAGRSLINTAVIIAGVIVLIYIAFTFLDIPALKSLPVNIDLKSIIPTSVFNEPMPMPQQPQQPIVPSQNFNQINPQTPEQPVLVNDNGDVQVQLPVQNSAEIDLKAASGKISIKAGNNSNQLIGGSIKLDANENLTQNASLNGQTAKYSFESNGNASSPQSSNWDLTLNSQRTIAVKTVLSSGYIKADLRSMDLSSVYLENKYGPVDVMVPNGTDAKIQISASGDAIRVYVPKGTTVSCAIYGASSVDYPQWDYVLTGNMLTPRRSAQTPVSVEINANNSSVQIITSE